MAGSICSRVRIFSFSLFQKSIQGRSKFFSRYKFTTSMMNIPISQMQIRLMDAGDCPKVILYTLTLSAIIILYVRWEYINKQYSNEARILERIEWLSDDFQSAYNDLTTNIHHYKIKQNRFCWIIKQKNKNHQFTVNFT